MCQNTAGELLVALQDSLELSLLLGGRWLSKEEIKDICRNEDVLEKEETERPFSEIVSILGARKEEAEM